ncbi:poly(ADP-ribose) glycohydrolase-like [Anneissia japonica]|uniref:poly(ADP-ribose) glycohydrolase-like n=1 Tax=Anneissia japonica TaxID=1529436 RepID=UPI00142593ED|nr:poly(ADP-ribose) glycohydrolase-like [Anneissia japonica]
MSDSPKRKRLKQSTLTAMFNTKSQQKQIEEEVLNEIFAPRVDSELQKQQRQLLAEAAENRRNRKSSPSAINNKCSDNSKPDRLVHYTDSRKSSANEKKIPSHDVPSTSAAAASASTPPTLEYDFEESPVLFSDSEPLSSQSQHLEDSNQSTQLVVPSPPPTLTREKSYGVPYSNLNRKPESSAKLPQLASTPDHTLLFRPHIRPGSAPRPYPDTYQDHWNNNFVRMPCSRENLYPFQDENGQKILISRWEMIKSTLLQGVSNSLDLEVAVLKYNARYCNKWNFRGLHSFFGEVLDEDEQDHFFQVTMPAIIDLALQLPNICTQSPPLLKCQKNHSITMTQKQVASLLANAFFCTFPRRNAQQKKSEYSRFPDINFNRLFEGSQAGIHPTKAEKLKCILNYFRRITTTEPTGTITFRRCAIDRFPEWSTSTARLRDLHVSTEGTIEDNGRGMLQMDFANKFVGGGVLGFGSVQEEIRFLICPELLVSRLFTEVLDDNECLLITGAERYSDYTGYANSFKWAGNHVDNTSRDDWGRRCTEIVAVDALVFHSKAAQYKTNLLTREINKAYCGFNDNTTPVKNRSAVATGNWGCGAFGGDPRLKALVQLMAAAECQRDMAYFTFNDARLCSDIHNIHVFLKSQDVSVSSLWNVILQYGKCENKTISLYDYIYQVYTNYDDSTDEENEKDDHN